MSRTSEALNLRVNALSTAAQAGSLAAAQDLVFLARLQPVSPQRTLPVIENLLHRQNIPETHDISSAVLCALEAFQLISIGLERGRQPPFATSPSHSIIPAMGPLVPAIKAWISHMTAIFFAGPAAGEVIGLEAFIPIIEVLLAEVMRLHLNQQLPSDPFSVLRTWEDRTFSQCVTRLWIHHAFHCPATKVTSLIHAISLSRAGETDRGVSAALKLHSNAEISGALSGYLQLQLSQRAMDTFSISALATLMRLTTGHLTREVVNSGYLASFVKLLFRLVSPRSKVARPQYGPSPATPDAQKASVIPPVLISVTSLLYHGYASVQTAVHRRLLVAVVKAHHRLRETSDIDLNLSIEPSKLIFKYIRGYFLCYSVVKHLPFTTYGIDNEIGSPGGALQAAWESFESALQDVALEDSAFMMRGGLVTGRHCGNPECSVEITDTLDIMRRCGGCLHVAYCSRLCQKKDWKSGHRQYCKDRVRDQNFGRLYTTKILPIDEEFWLFRTERIMRQSGQKFHNLPSNPDGNVVLVVNISESTIRWHPLPICADYWDQSDEEEPWTVFCSRVEELVKVGEFPMLILVPMKDYSRPLKFVTSIQRIRQRRYFNP